LKEARRENDKLQNENFVKEKSFEKDLKKNLIKKNASKW